LAPPLTVFFAGFLPAIVLLVSSFVFKSYDELCRVPQLPTGKKMKNRLKTRNPKHTSEKKQKVNAHIC